MEKIDVNYSWTLQTPGTHSQVCLGTEDIRKGEEVNIIKSGQKMLNLPVK